MIKMTRWRSCVNTPPKKDGDYLVIRCFNGTLSYAANLHYTVAYGWNTHNDGYTEHRIVFDRKNKYDRACLWTEITQVKGKRK